MTTNFQPSARDAANLEVIQREAAVRASKARYTKKDYESFARILARIQNNDESEPDYDEADTGEIAEWNYGQSRQETKAIIAHHIADLFAQDCPKFDRARFLKDCQVTP